MFKIPKSRTTAPAAPVMNGPSPVEVPTELEQMLEDIPLSTQKAARKKDPRNFKSNTLPMNEAEYSLLTSLSKRLDLSLNDVLRLGMKKLDEELKVKTPGEVIHPETSNLQDKEKENEHE